MLLSYKFYLHDHLYSPAALVHWLGSVLERYEYDAYGNCYVMDASYSPRTKSSYGNPFYFQGKYLDLLDNGNLDLMSWPYRNYSTYLGRWYQPDKLGMIPNDSHKINSFEPRKQFKDGANFYEYLTSNPVRQTDPYGLEKKECPCGPDVTGPLSRFKEQLTRDFNSWPWWKKHLKCSGMWGTDRWDIVQLHGGPGVYPCCAIGDCKETVAVHGKCYSQHAVNYYMWGVMNSLCYSIFARADAEIGLIWPLISGDYGCKREWAKAGLKGRTTGVNCPEYDTCKMTCSVKITKDFDYRWRFGVPIFPPSWE